VGLNMSETKRISRGPATQEIGKTFGAVRVVGVFKIGAHAGAMFSLMCDRGHATSRSAWDVRTKGRTACCVCTGGRAVSAMKRHAAPTTPRATVDACGHYWRPQTRNTRTGEITVDVCACCHMEREFPGARQRCTGSRTSLRLPI